MVYRWAVIGAVVLLLLVGFQGERNEAFAQRPDKDWICKVISVQGRVLVKRQGEAGWQAVGLNDALFAGDQIRVEANSRAGIVLSNDAVLRLDQNTTLVLTEIEKETTFIFKLLRGAANFFSRRARSLKIFTPFVNGVVEGTEFYVQVDADQTRIDLFEGRILAQNAHGELHLVKGQGAVALAGSAPQRRLLVQPRDSVQWALYYPPVLVFGPDEVADELKESLKLYNQGKTLEAVHNLEQVEEPAKDAEFFAYRAALLLHLGRISRARDDIRQALAADPNHSEALALQAVIAVVQNRKAQALKTAQQAVQVNPQSAAAQMALSYAQQAGFDLTGALKTVQAAVKYAPENGTAWARLAELRLSTGKLDQGIQAARKAAQLNPNVAHAHTMLGFACLTQIKTEKAREAFEKAITLDSAAPLPRLGLGLAKIRDGNLEQGRSEIEIAAGLDPVNALIRSYLGKAYFDEKRGPLDEKQLEIAKTLDPNDPTPWLYDAIRKQSINRPVEALDDLQTSIQLNDNRAIYRSRLQLDEDLATRSASLGRIFNDLDFQHLALVEGYKSLDRDSTNYSAHRLLADNYAAKPRHEIARVNELLQAQLFQPLNLTPIQARLAETNTAFFDGAGPATLAFNEFNPLFTRNRTTLQASGIGGGNDTWGHEVTGSGIFDRLSLSVSELHYQTDGFRENNDDSQDVFDLFFQGSLTHNTSIQAEYRDSQRESGDLSQNFDGVFSTAQRDTHDIIKKRIGLHHNFFSHFELVASAIQLERKSERNSTFSTLPGTWKNIIDSDLYEVRTDFRRNRFGLITGFSYMDGTLYEDFRVIFLGSPYAIIDNEEENFLKKNAYAYSSLEISDRATVLIGLSVDSLEVGSQIEKKQSNPKLGLTLRPSLNTTLRLAGFRVLSSRYENVQIIEPTQVSGFSQFFDDLDASDVKAYGIAVDQKFTNQLFGGLEFLRRDLEVPQFVIETKTQAVFFDWNEATGLAYLYWAPINVLSLRAEYQYEHFYRSENPIESGIVDVDSHRIPLSVHYFHPDGVSIKLGATYFFQEGEFAATNNSAVRFSDSVNFWVIDAEISYRLPKRWGILTAGIKNLLDEEFNYKETDPSNPAAVPGFLGFAKITLSF